MNRTSPLLLVLAGSALVVAAVGSYALEAATFERGATSPLAWLWQAVSLGALLGGSWMLAVGLLRRRGAGGRSADEDAGGTMGP